MASKGRNGAGGIRPINCAKDSPQIAAAATIVPHRITCAQSAWPRYTNGPAATIGEILLEGSDVLAEG